MADGRIGKYTIVGELGAGAMGVVYKAVDPVIGRTVAIKTIRFELLTNAQQREEAQKRFLREAQSAGNLSHPNIVTIYDVGEDQGLTYIAMEYVEGRSLEEILAAQQPWDLGAAINLVVQIAEGLDSAHRKGIVHRDIKPANVLVDKEGRPKIVDFGIARISSSNLTQTSMVMGTPFYMAPEQVAGKKVDHRADIFALGAMFYEILSLRKPFNGDTLTTVIYKIMSEVPPPLSQVVAGVPRAVDAVVERAMAKDPETRYQSCRELIHDMRQCAASLGYALEAIEPPVVGPAPAAESRWPSAVPAPAEGAARISGAIPAVEGVVERSRRPLFIVLALMMVVVAAVVVALLVMKKEPRGTLAQGGGGGPASNPSGEPAKPTPQGTPDSSGSQPGQPVKPPPDKPSPEVKKGETRDSRLIREVPPAYPETARAAGVEGEVEVLAVIGPDGQVKDAAILKSVPLLDQAAIEAVRQYVFEPALRDGVPVESSMKLSLTFTLPAESRPPPKAEPSKTETPPTKAEPTKPADTPVKRGQTRPVNVVRRVEPEYPDLARQARVEGDVTIQVTIGPSGRIERAIVVEGAGLLDEAALKAVRQWTFEPALRDGVPVSSTLNYTLSFRLGLQTSTSKVEPNKPTTKPVPSGDHGKVEKPSTGTGGGASGGAAAAAEIARASEALSQRNYRQAADSARRALATNPASPEAQSILTNALIQLAPVEIKSLVDQYVLSLKVKQTSEFYRLRAAPALAARVQKDMDVVMGAYDQIQAAASNITLDLKEMRYPNYRARASFVHQVSGVSRQKGTRETLFDGRYIWRLERRDETWIILDISYDTTK